MFNNVKEVLKDSKKKSIIQLCLYFIFFVFVFIVISSGNDKPIENKVENVDNSADNSVNNYEYVYRIINNENILEVTGKLKDNEQIFTYNALNYYKNDSGIYLLDDTNLTYPQNIDFNIDKYSYQNMESLIEKSEFIEETTYKDNSKKTTYNININDYFDTLKEENNCNEIDCSNINATVIVEESDYINNININLTNYYNYNYNIEISYSNINNISEIKTNTD